MFCNYCGKPNPDVAAFCRECGKPITRPRQPPHGTIDPVPVAEVPAAAAAPAAPSPPTAVETAPAAGRSRSIRPILALVVVAVMAVLLAGGWVVLRGGRERTLKGHSSYISSVVFSPDGRMLASGSDDGTVKLWDATSGQWLRTFALWHQSDWVAFSPDGGTIASTSSLSEGVVLVDLASGRRIRTLSGHGGYVGDPKFSLDGRRIAFSTSDTAGNPTLRVFDVASGTETGAWPGYWGVCAFILDGRSSIIWTRSHAIVQVDMATGSQMRELTGPVSGEVHNTECSRDGQRAAVVMGTGSTIAVWNTAGGEPIRTITESAPVRGIAFSPDARVLATASEDHLVKLWDLTSGAKLLELSGHADNVNVVGFSPDGMSLASGDSDALIRLWAVPRK